MKKTKRLVALLVVSIMLVAALFAVAACDEKIADDDDTFQGGAFDITMWVSDTAGVKDQFAEQVKKFNETDGKYTFNATIEAVSEADSATKMITDVESGADVFCFAQDQTARLVQAGALSQPGKKAVALVSEDNDASSVKAATVGGKVRAYPLTSDNGYFMMYDKRVIKESSLDSLEKIIADCENASKNISFEMGTSAWYLASFFFATGCTSDWTIDADGKPTGITDTFNSPEGIIAMKGMQTLVKSSAHVSSSKAADFGAAIPSAVVITGTWELNEAKKQLGDNLGMTDLPSFTVDGQSYHLGSYSGNKLMGVKPTNDPNKAAGLSRLARYLTNEECQLQRFNEFGWGPSNKEAQKDKNVKADAALSALAKQNEYAVPQGVIDGSWWDTAKVLGDKAKAATSDADLQKALDEYDAANEAAINVSPEDARKWSVIGVGGDWSTDYAMTESPENTWISNDAFTFAVGDTFKCRQGGKWDVSYGGNGPDGNYLVETAGKYKVKIVVTVDADGKVTAGEVTLVPAE